MLSPANTPLAPGCDRARKPSDTRPGHDPARPRSFGTTTGVAHRRAPHAANDRRHLWRRACGATIHGHSPCTEPAAGPRSSRHPLTPRPSSAEPTQRQRQRGAAPVAHPHQRRQREPTGQRRGQRGRRADRRWRRQSERRRSAARPTRSPNQLRAAGRPQLRSDHVLLRQQHGAVATGSVTISTPHRSAPTRAAASLAPRPPANPVKAPAAAVHGRGRFGRTRGAMSRLSRASDPFSSRSGVAHHLNAGETLVVVASGQPPRLAMLLTVHVRDTVPFAARLMVYVSPVATAVAVSVKLLAVPVALLM
jgi:hypothetical protein